MDDRNGLTWAEYLERCRKNEYALYISGMDKTEPQETTELNYQFLNTLALTDDEFRPLDLPLGWDIFPLEKDVFNSPDRTIRFAGTVAVCMGIRRRHSRAWPEKYLRLRKELGMLE